jgi:DNA-binding winged helix-turn-helix (wHTH) protein
MTAGRTKSRTGGTKHELLRLLAESRKAWVSYAEIIDALWGHDPGGGPLDPRRNISVHVMHLRRALRAYGVEIRNVSGAGYRIPREQRGRAREVMNELAEVCSTAPQRPQRQLCPHCGRRLDAGGPVT